MKKFLISLVISLLLCGSVYAAPGQATPRPGDFEALQVTSVNVKDGSAVVYTGSGWYVGCKFMVTTADHQVAIVDSSSTTLAADVNLTLLDERAPVAKSAITDNPSRHIWFDNGLTVIVTDATVDGVVRFIKAS
jgi:hypothetical protein